MCVFFFFFGGGSVFFFLCFLRFLLGFSKLGDCFMFDDGGASGCGKSKQPALTSTRKFLFFLWVSKGVV